MSGGRTAWDVLIVGGGPVGACAAALLQRVVGAGHAPLRIGLLEPAPPAPVAADSPIDTRVSAWSRASERILRAAGAWEHMAPQRLAPYERMCVWPESLPARSPDALVFDAAYAGDANLGVIAENRLAQCAALQAFTVAGGTVLAQRFAGARIDEQGVQVHTAAGTERCRLLVGADGARSQVRAAVGLSAHVHSYGQKAIIANVRTERPHERTAWQRFMRSGTLAFLPLADACSSIVWSVDETRADELLSMDASEFEQALLRASDGVLGGVRLCTQRAALPLRRVRAERFTGMRCALIGDAAHVVHPLAGQGVNLGLLDAAALAECVAQACQMGEDPGAGWPLRRYERWRKSELVPMTLAIDAFNRWLAHGTGPLSRLSQRGLSWVNRSDALKRFFISRALGVAGELPAAARRSGTGL